MSFDGRERQEVPNAPKLGIKPLSLDDDEFLPDIPIKLNNFDLDPNYDVEMSYTSQSPTPTQNRDPSALFTGTDGLRSAFNSPSKRNQNGYEGENLFHRSPSEKHFRLHKERGNAKDSPQDVKGKGKAAEAYDDAQELEDNTMTGLSTTGFTKPDENGWESYERFCHSDQQEYKTSSTSQHRLNSGYPN